MKKEQNASILFIIIKCSDIYKQIIDSCIISNQPNATLKIFPIKEDIIKSHISNNININNE